MIIPEVRGYGDFDRTSFEDYLRSLAAELSNFPRCVVENWSIGTGKNSRTWADRSVEKFAFEMDHFSNHRS